MTSRQDGVEVGGAVARDQCARAHGIRGLAEEEDDFDVRLPGASSTGVLQRAAGIEAGADAAGAGRALRQRRRLGERAVACRGTRGGRRSRRSAGRPDRRTPRAPPKAVLHGLRANIAPVAGVDLGDDERRRGGARRAEHPLDVGGHRQPARPAAAVAERQARDLDGVVERHELQQVERDAVRLVLEAAVALAVAGHVGMRPVVADRQRGRAPQLAGVLVAEDRAPRPGGSLTGSFDQGVSWFSRLLSDQV